MNYSPAVISFDYFGAIIDWRKGILGCLKPLFDDYLVDLSEDEIISMFNSYEIEILKGDFLSYRTVLHEIMKSFSKDLNLNLMKYDLDCLFRSVINWEAFEDSREVLKILRNNYKTALIVNCDNDLLDKSLLVNNLKFDFLVTSFDLKTYKPSLNNFARALEVFKVPSDEVLHITQNPERDILACNELGIESIWINRYSEDIDFDTPQKPDSVINSLFELQKML